MRFFRLGSLLLLAAALAGVGAARAALPWEETNLWPLQVAQRRALDAAAGTALTVDSWAGPLGFARASPHERVVGVRPIWVRFDDPVAGQRRDFVLYPLLRRVQRGDERSWSVFNLINSDRRPELGPDGVEWRAFDVWPFYFSRDTGDPETSYRALFPVAGTLRGRLFHDRLHWIAFPLYLEAEHRGAVTTHMPWPFVRHISGEGHGGFELWPLYGRRGRPGDYERSFALWPLFLHHETHQGDPTRHTVKRLVLPFYTSHRTPNEIHRNYLWPFFGTSERIEPAYRETRWFWPLLVQGRGEGRQIERWAPVYTYSHVHGVDKTWVLWPLWRRQQWTDEALRQTKSQLLYFVYWNLDQRAAARPEEPFAHKTHLWPLFSTWDNGAGRRQFQTLSPLEPFFQHNDVIRQVYSPLFALHRFERDGDLVRSSTLWNLVTYQRHAEAKRFSLGPLYTYERDATGRAHRFLFGLLGFDNRPPPDESSPAAADRPDLSAP